jgi:anoctamin-5
VLFELAYKRIALIVTELENYQYQTQFDDTLITRLFRFNFFNFYLPLFLAAFVKRDY